MARTEQAEDLTAVSIPTNGGMYSGGGAAEIPQGFFRKIRNMLRRAGVWEKRPQFTYDNLTNVRGLGLWFDTANGKRRLVSVDSADVVRVKATTGESWSGSVGTVAGDGVLLDSASFRGKFYGITGTTAREPSRFFEYNGTSTDLIALDGSKTQFDAFVPLSVAPYKGRLFFGGVKLNIYNYLLADSTNYVYDASTWTLTNVTVVTSTVGGGTICRITPTNNTTASLQGGSFAVQCTDGIGQTIRLRYELRNTNPAYRVPVTLQAKYDNAWLDATAYVIGDYVAPGNGFIYRCRIAGTSAGVEPVWPTTIGSEIVDNTVTWICDATDIAAQQKVFVVSTENFTPFSFSAKAPDGMSNSLGVLVRIIFGHDGAAYTITSLDFSFRDGKSDADPTKENHGQQVTFGTFDAPFFNGETNADNVVDHSDYLYWTPVGEPTKVSASSFFRVHDQPGPITAAREVDGRLCVFKRNSVTPFGVVEDTNTVVLPEGSANVGFGALNARAVRVGPDNYAWIVGEDEIYRWAPGMDSPEIRCGDAMRVEMFNKASASWVESQTFPANAALLEIDPKARLLFVYTQKGAIHVQHLDDKTWSVFDSGGDATVSPVGKQICDMIYNPNTGNMVVAFTEAAAGTAGIARLDATQAVAQDSISTSGTSAVHAELWPKPFELTGPRHEICLDNVKIYHNVTSSQSGQATTAYVSRDHGITFPKSNQVTLAPISTGGYRPMRFSLFQQWGSLLLRILHSGNGGASSFNVSRMEADIQTLSGEYTKDLPTSGAATL